MTTLENTTTMWKLSSDAFQRDCVLPWSPDLTAAKISTRPKKKTKKRKARRQRVESEGSLDNASCLSRQNISVALVDTNNSVSVDAISKRARNKERPLTPTPTATSELSNYDSEGENVASRARKLKREELGTSPSYGENFTTAVETCDGASTHSVDGVPVDPMATKSVDRDTPVSVPPATESVKSSDISDRALISDNPVTTKSEDLDDDGSSDVVEIWGHPTKKEDELSAALPASFKALETIESSEESEAVPEIASTAPTETGNGRYEDSSSRHADGMAYFAEI